MPTHIETITGISKTVPLAPYTTFRVGGPARYLIEATSREQIANTVRAARADKLPITILGGGSNVLISDAGIDGVVIVIKTTGVQIDGTHVVAEAGTLLQRCIQDTIKAGLAGLEHLVGIPGSIGGAIAGNAGTAQRWIAENITSVWIVDERSEIIQLPKEACNFSYRNSRFKNSQTEFILAGEFDLTPDDVVSIRKRSAEFIAKRKKQPAGDACAGCIFKNTDTIPAGKLIDELGLKGKRIGGAYVSEDHGNFIVNDGTATAEDIVILISYIKQQVRDARGIQLHEEVRMLGF